MVDGVAGSVVDDAACVSTWCCDFFATCWFLHNTLALQLTTHALSISSAEQHLLKDGHNEGDQRENTFPCKRISFFYV